ncbi:MAG: hypothetical protein ACLVB8_18680 [Bacteroides thetaiotaomicron]
MKLNLNKPLIDFRGKEAIKIVNGKEQKQFLRDMVSEALYAAGMNPQSVWIWQKNYVPTICSNKS